MTDTYVNDAIFAINATMTATYVNDAIFAINATVATSTQ